MTRAGTLSAAGPREEAAVAPPRFFSMGTPADAAAVAVAAVAPVIAWPGLHDPFGEPKAATFKALVCVAAALDAVEGGPRRRLTLPVSLRVALALLAAGTGVWLWTAPNAAAAFDGAELLACWVVWTRLVAGRGLVRPAASAALAGGVAAAAMIAGLGLGAPSFAAAAALAALYGATAAPRRLARALAAALAVVATAAGGGVLAALAGAVAFTEAGRRRRSASRWGCLAAAAAASAFLAWRSWAGGAPGGELQELRRAGGWLLVAAALIGLLSLIGLFRRRRHGLGARPWGALACFLTLDALGGAPLATPAALVWLGLCVAAALRARERRADRSPSRRARALLVLLAALIVGARLARSLAAQRLFFRAERAAAAGRFGEAADLAARAQAFGGHDPALRRLRASLDERGLR